MKRIRRSSSPRAIRLISLAIIRRFASATETTARATTFYDYGSIADDCPRLSATRVSADNWTGINDVPQEVATLYGVEGNAHTLTVVGDPNSTLYKEFYGTGWQRGLTTQTEVWSAGVEQKWTTNEWTQDQDNTGINYQTNPRVTETNIYDGSNHRRVTTTYTTSTLPGGASCSLPSDTREYAGDASTILRHTHVSYRMDSVADVSYLSRHILGLVKEQTLYDASGGTETLMSKVGFGYDESGSVQGTDAPVSHDNSYDGNFVTGRANLTSVKRYDDTVSDNSQFTMSSMKYNTAGGVVDATDPLSHHTTVNYADSFSDSNNSRNTLAYPTSVTDPDGYSSTVTYNFDFGAVTRKQTPQPNTLQNIPGPVQTMAYDAAGRIERVAATTNNAYTRYVYGPNYVLSLSTVNNIADEAYSNTVFDGMGRTVVAARNHPGSSGGYSAVNTIYDRMGQAVKQSNPTETNDAWVPAGDDAAGWHYTQQSYDWKGRALVTTNPDGTTKEASYSGCGCAGGAVVTLTDEGTIDGGVPKRRQQKIYSDVLGRTVKTEILNWQGGSPYATTINSYNARDQVTRSRQFDTAQGTVPSDPNDLSCPTGSCQQTTMTYDGYGRLKTKHVPEQNEGTETTWNYNADDTVQSVIDARGASQTFNYNNNRHLVTGITYSAPTGIPSTPNVSFVYDAVGNRTSMNDGMGSVGYQYDQLSRMTSEARTFSDTGNSSINGLIKTVSYEYNLAGELKSITDPAGATINYGFDVTGRLSAVTGSSFGGVTTYASGAQYRAWGAPKHLAYGNTKTLDATYNARLQAASFNIPGVMSKTYDYYADGQLRFSSDLLDHRFDRSYSNDHLGRLKEAFSGAEARGEAATNDRPYKQTFGYDGFGHLTNRASNNWSDFYTMPQDSYTNNRRDGWDYDAEGNLSGSVDATYTYDAGGEIRTVGTYEPQSTTTRGLDGERRQVKTVESTYKESSQTWETTTAYYLHSTVLGGQVLTELGPDGAKTRTFVYAGGTVLAWQKFFGTFQAVEWEHRDASNATFGTTDISGSGSVSAELDPTGADVGTHAPLISPNPPDENSGSLVPYPSFNDSHTLTRTYRVDGITVPADYFWQAVDTTFHGSFLEMAQYLVRASSRIVGYRSAGVRFGRTFDATYDTHWHMTSLSEGSSHDPNLAGYSIESPIYDNSWSFAFTMLPQNTPTKTAEQQKCDDKIADIFGGNGAVAAANGFEPVGGNPKSSGTFRGTGQDISDRAIHIYGNGAKNVNTGVYLPGKITGAIYPNPQTLDEYKGGSFVAFYSNLNGLKNVSLIVTHLAGFTANSRQQNDAGSRYVGTTGGKGAEDEDYLHAHLELVQGRVRRFHSTVAMKHYSFAEVFCK